MIPISFGCEPIRSRWLILFQKVFEDMHKGQVQARIVIALPWKSISGSLGYVFGLGAIYGYGSSLFQKSILVSTDVWIGRCTCTWLVIIISTRLLSSDLIFKQSNVSNVRSIRCWSPPLFTMYGSRSWCPGPKERYECRNRNCSVPWIRATIKTEGLLSASLQVLSRYISDIWIIPPISSL